MSHTPAPSPYICRFEADIDDQHVSTESRYLANLYQTIQRLVTHDDDAATPWPFILPNLKHEVRDFAATCLRPDDPAIDRLRKQLALACDMYEMDEEDLPTVRGVLLDCIPLIQQLEVLLPPRDLEAERAEIERKLRLPEVPIELKIVAHHETRDMSVGNHYAERMYVSFGALKVDEMLPTESLRCGPLRVEEVSETAIALRSGNDLYRVKIEESFQAPSFLVDNPYLSSDLVTLVFSYYRLTPYEQARDLLRDIAEVHEQRQQTVYRETTKAEQCVLDLLNEAINGGMVEVYPLKALLAASNNWATGLIVRRGLFQNILLEGIEKGCLAPDKEVAWEWLDTAAVNNDPTFFMTDMERYYDILCTAAEAGNNIALNLMNTIWEPEQIIEED